MQFIKQILFLVMVLPAFSMYSQSTDSLVDNRDGKIYKTKKFGDKIWMTENLNFVTDKSWCYKND
ncbi:MAG: FISUMP domain-containing protein, partial [Bacteroidales bacterium]|nr:FISUMP domain-containing protein [Bacteroidales bacterium]